MQATVGTATGGPDSQLACRRCPCPQAQGTRPLKEAANSGISGDIRTGSFQPFPYQPQSQSELGAQLYTQDLQVE